MKDSSIRRETRCRPTELDPRRSALHYGTLGLVLLLLLIFCFSWCQRLTILDTLGFASDLTVILAALGTNACWFFLAAERTLPVWAIVRLGIDPYDTLEHEPTLS